MLVLSIDIGLINLGLVVALASRDGLRWRVENYLHCALVDLTELGKQAQQRVLHGGGPSSSVDSQRRSNKAAVWCDQDATLANRVRVTHMIDEFCRIYQPLLDVIDLVVVERQPPEGFRCIEELLVNAVGEERVILHDPQTTHAFFGWNKPDDEDDLLPDDPYERRKVLSTRRAEHEFTIRGAVGVRDDFAKLSRQHDVADAVCQLLARLSKIRPPPDVVNPRFPTDDWWKKFAY